MATSTQPTAIKVGSNGSLQPFDQPPSQSSQSKSIKTTTTTTTKTIYTTTTKQKANENLSDADEVSSVAYVEDLGKQATPISANRTVNNRKVSLNSTGSMNKARQHYQQVNGNTDRTKNTQTNATKTTTTNQQVSKLDETVNGNRLVTTISTIAAQSGHSRLVLALLKDGNKLQLKIQEMRPGMFEVGGNLSECIKYLEEHRKLIVNLRKQKQTPIECWMQKYQKIAAEKEPNMSSERKLVYMCMVENLQSCWKALLNQLDERLVLLEESCIFYELAAQLAEALDKADQHVQVFRQQFLDGPNSNGFNEACSELRRLNEASSNCYNLARAKQQRVVSRIGEIGNGNLGDARVNYLMTDAQNLINYINTYLEPLEKRRIQLESVITTSKTTTIDQYINVDSNKNNSCETHNKTNSQLMVSSYQGSQANKQQQQYNSFPVYSTTTTKTTNLLREISNFNDLNLVENWLQVKIDQLNSSLLSSLGVSVPDSRSIATKHEQIALECRAIEEASITFNGRNINAIKSIDPKDDKSQGDKSLFEQQKLLSTRTRDVITILDARLVLLRRSIDFYLRSKEATSDIAKMMRRLQVDNSLQSVQFVSNELELKDVSSVVASGATIISELQQLQLAQQHGQRSKIVNLNLATSGIRAIIDQLNQDLAHLKTMLNQRRLVLLNEDAAKMANNFSNKCHQLQFWLNNHVKSFLITYNSLNVNDLSEVRQFCDNYEQLRVNVQGKTLEVEALLRSLTTLTEHFDPKSKTVEDIQRITDELRHDWINATNCLEGRLDFGRKYLAILSSCSALSKELTALDRFNSGQESASPDERTDADIRSNINQILLQLANQVKNFQLDAKKNSTQFVHSPQSTLVGAPFDDIGNPEKLVVNDLNKQQLLDRASELQKRFEDEQQFMDNQRLQAQAKLQQQQPDPAHQRPQQVDPPRFTRVLVDRAVEPFSTVELVCELDQANCQVDWFMNNFKKIPSTIRHTISSEGNQHKLVINNFSSICCGSYLARASNNAGQATSQCKLKLAGIKETTQEGEQSSSSSGAVQVNQREVTVTQQQSWQQENKPRSSQNNRDPKRQVVEQAAPQIEIETASDRSSGSQRQVAEESGGSTSRQTRGATTIEESTETISRIIQGVDEKVDNASLSANDELVSGHPLIRVSQLNTSDSDITIDTTTTRDKFPVTKAVYSGEPTGDRSNGPVVNHDNHQQHLRVSYIDSPDVSSATLSRSVSKSPFEGTPQPPVFVQGLQNTMPRCCSRAGLVCLVMGNPAPTIEWLHNNQTIATAKCSRPASGYPRGSLCKLTIETMSPQTQGQYTCRASNRLGKSSTDYTLTNK